MTYFEFLDDIIKNFRVSKMIEIIKVEQNEDTQDLVAVSYEATRALIVVANYHQTPDIEIPKVQGLSQLDFIKQIIGIASGASKTSVKFKENSEGVATETIFKMDKATIKNKNVAKSLLPETPKNLSKFAPDVEVELDKDIIAEILRLLSLNIFNASAYLTKSKNGNLTIELTNNIDGMDYETPYELPEGVLDLFRF